MANLTLNYWDLILLVSVTAMGVTLAYLLDPKWKAFLTALPIPFTLTTMSMMRPVDATNVIGLALIVGYTHSVRMIYRRLHLPIAIAIIVSAAGYCVAATALVRVLPPSDGAFRAACIGTLLLGLILTVAVPHVDEPGHKSPMPIWLKLPIMALVVFFVIVVKKYLHGFMAVFPIIGVIASYESRHSLSTVCRQAHGFILSFVPMMIACRFLQPKIGMGWSLAAGWIVYGVLAYIVTKAMWAVPARTVEARQES